ncbi:MAG: TonB C-terminal domain-containing protein, partial [Clostridiaceae bacterium]|nr:TonB C-terminal domain-containing protein [Clostridiaceae bacterium]
QARPQPPTARPSIRPQFTPRAVNAPTSNFRVPVPKGGTGAGRYVSGPISGSGHSARGGGNGGYGSGGHGFGPSLAPTGGQGGSGTRLARGGGGGSGYGGGNPGGGGGRPGIDALREPDFGPYMRELQRRIKMNWDPPKGNESKRVVLLFKIAKDGRLLACSVFKSSGLQSADRAALHAVQLTAPFRPLPAEYRGKSIDIQFTFDYNVFGATGYN